MKKLGLSMLLLAIAMMLGTSALAQNVGDNSYYFVTYFSNANTAGAPDGTLRIVNDGASSTASVEGAANGVLWADIYVYNDSEELEECCSCKITADGLLSESVNLNLTSNTLTGREETSRGVIKVVADSAANPTAFTTSAGLHGWATHIQATSVTLPNKEKGPFFVTETPLADSDLSSAEATALESSCSFAITLGSGYGQCSCSTEDYDF
jgi:hypothetical protein